MRNNQSSIGQELRWLLLFALIFALIAFLMLHFVVPHHFNDRIAIAIATILSGGIMIALRAWQMHRTPMR